MSNTKINTTYCIHDRTVVRVERAAQQQPLMEWHMVCVRTTSGRTGTTGLYQQQDAPYKRRRRGDVDCLVVFGIVLVSSEDEAEAVQFDFDNMIVVSSMVGRVTYFLVSAELRQCTYCNGLCFNDRIGGYGYFEILFS
jgi:hypothetical protein